MKIPTAIAGLLLATMLGGCAASWNNRGGFTDEMLDTYWTRADSKDHRALRAYAIQGALLRIGMTTARTERQKKSIGWKNFLATLAYRDLLNCIWSLSKLEEEYLLRQGETTMVRAAPLSDCPYFDTRMRGYEDALFEMALSAFAYEEEMSFLKHALSGKGDILATLFSIGEAAVRTGRAALPLYRDMIELEVLVWRDAMPKAELSLEHRTGLDRLAIWKKQLATLKETQAPPPVQPQHVYYVSQIMDETCRELGLDDAKTSCSLDLPFLPAFAKRKAGVIKALAASDAADRNSAKRD